MRDMDDHSPIPLGQRREAACSCMFGGRGGCGARMGRQMEAQSFREEMKLQLMVNIDKWFGGEEEVNGWRMP